MNLVVAELKRITWRRATWGIVIALGIFGLLLWWGMSASWVGRWDYGDRPEIPPDFISGSIEAVAIIVAVGVFFWGASMIGAEMTTGSLAAWLTFVPSRTKVWWSKAAAIAVGGVAIGGAMLAGYMVMMSITFARAGVIRWPDYQAFLGRALVFIVVAAVAGYALAAAFGRTVAAPIAVGLYVMVLVSRSIFGLFGYGGLEVLPWVPEFVVHAFLAGGASLPTYPNGYDAPAVPFEVSAVAAGAYLCGMLAVLMAASWAWFTRRDHSR